MKNQVHIILAGLLSLSILPGNVDARNVFGDIEAAVKKAGKDINRTAVKAGKDTEATVNKAGKDINRTAIKAGKDINQFAIKTGKEGENFVQDVDAWIKTGDCGGDICDTIAKAVEDTVDESERAAENIEDAGQAIGHFVENQAHSVGDTLADAEERVREGKVIDAIWHLGTDPVRHTSKNAAAAAEESKLIASVGQIAASAYGGPQGAAAFASWLTYEQTCNQGSCNPELALRVGMITGATSWAMGEVGKLPSKTTSQIVKKAVVSGAIGGLAVAVSGGDEDSIRKGFMLSAGAVLIRDGYKKITTHELDARPSKGDAYCMSTTDVELGCAPKAAYKRNPDGSIAYKKNPDGSFAYKKDPNGNIAFKKNTDGTFYMNKQGEKVPIKIPVIEDISRLEPRRPRVGNWGDETKTKLRNVNYETAPVMKGLSKVPAMNAMAVFHDQWSFDVKMDTATNVVTIVPAAVLTYVGTGAPSYDLIKKTNMNSSRKSTSSRTNSAISALDVNKQDTVPFSSGIAAASMLCIHGKKSRRIIVDAPSDEPGFACRVIYQNERGTSVPWYARNEVDYCHSKAVAFTVKQIALGWSCYAQ